MYNLEQFKNGHEFFVYNDLLIHKEKIICVDIETTGFDMLRDEILQISIMNGFGGILFNEYIKPEHVNVWPDAQAVNHISPSMVASERHLSAYRRMISDIFRDAWLVVGYNHVGFDLPFLAANQIDTASLFGCYDVMLHFSDLIGERRPQGDIKWQKLTKCAEYYGFNPGPGLDFHNSLVDVKATLHCFYKMFENALQTDN